MVSFNVYRSTYSGAYVEGICLATDEKPVVGIANGSILFAVDISTGETTRYMYDQESMSWIEAECPCSGGGSGGGSGSGGGALAVTCSESGVLDKTWQEIYDAMAAGNSVTVSYPAFYSETEYDLRVAVVPVAYKYVGEHGTSYVVEVGGGGFDSAAPNGYPKDENMAGDGGGEKPTPEERM